MDFLRDTGGIYLGAMRSAELGHPLLADILPSSPSRLVKPVFVAVFVGCVSFQVETLQGPAEMVGRGLQFAFAMFWNCSNLPVICLLLTFRISVVGLCSFVFRASLIHLLLVFCFAGSSQVRSTFFPPLSLAPEMRSKLWQS